MKKLRLNTQKRNLSDSEDYSVLESEQYFKDFEEIVLWIYLSNIEVSEDFAHKQTLKFNIEIDKLIARLMRYPESGLDEDDTIGIKRFPLYDGRYVVKWHFDHRKRIVTLLSIFDLRYPKES